MRVALFLGHPAAVIDPRRAEKARDVQHIGQPIDANRKVALQIVDEILRQIGIGAFVIDIDGEVLRFSHTGHLSFSPSRGYHAVRPPRSHPVETLTPDRPGTPRISGTTTIASTPTCGASTSRPRSINGTRRP